MNGLALRINPSEKKKTKNLMNFKPVTFEFSDKEDQKKLFTEFLNSTSVDEQLRILKIIFHGNPKDFDTQTLKFLALTFLQAEVKHPVKCFIARHITRNEAIEEPFSIELSKYIKQSMHSKHDGCQSYINVVSKIFTCIENFPAGSAAIKQVDVDLAEYLKCCLQCCRSTLSTSNTLSPTEKNEIYSLAHVSIRMLLHIIQKVNTTSEAKLMATFDCLRTTIKFILFDKDAPIDSKFISGMLLLTMMLLEFGAESWIRILDHSQDDSYIGSLLRDESAKLSLYSAIATVVALEQLQTIKIREKSALIYLTECIIEIGERNSSESIFTLAVSRAIVQLSKLVERVSARGVGDELMVHLAGCVWPLLDHYTDGVRHLAAQALDCLVRYCARLEDAGDAEPLSRLMEDVLVLDTSRRSYHVALGSLARLLPVSRLLPFLPSGRLLPGRCPLPAATATLEILVEKHARESNPRALYEQWVAPMLRQAADDSLEPAALAALEQLLARVVAVDENVLDYIFPHIKEASVSGSAASGNLKCTLMLLSVARKSGVVSRLAEQQAAAGEWKGVVGYDVLRAAAVDAVDETRLLTLALVVDSPKSTEPFSAGELSLVEWFLRHNVNAQSPHFRQRALALEDKFLKRIENSYKVLVRQSEPGSDGGQYYLRFVERLRRLCFCWLRAGGNLGRRGAALQLLLGGGLLLGGRWEWREQDVAEVLRHLEDGYEANRERALALAGRVPLTLLQGKSYPVSLDLESIIRQACALKPTECVSASYKLLLLVRRLPDVVVHHNNPCASVEATFIIVQRLIREATQRWERSGGCAGEGARSPSYGLLHCARRLLAEVAPVLNQSSSNLSPGPEEWKRLVEEAIDICMRLSIGVEGVVSRDAPEGALPPLPLVEPAPGHVGVVAVALAGGGAASAQMVLMAAWRAVKEASLLLGTIASELPIEGEEEGEGGGLVTPRQVEALGEHLGGLLARTQHRGAFEQVYVAYTQLLARLWRCRQSCLHGLPRIWAGRLRAGVARPGAGVSRRSAGLPLLVQALVTTELQVQGNPRCLHECMTTLLKLAQRGRNCPLNDTTSNQNSSANDKEILIENSILGDCLETDTEVGQSQAMSKDSLVKSRTHSMNILRALFRNSALEESVSGYVEEGLIVALTGFEGDTWMERNSATLLFSALVGRVFGPPRPRGPHRADRQVTARRLGPRYLHLLEQKLSVASPSVDRLVEGCVLPALVFLSRLARSARDGGRGGGASGTARLAACVRERARAGVLAERALAAPALVPLVPADRYLTYIESMFTAIQDPGMKRNHCHGVLLQLSKFLGCRPDGLVVPADFAARVAPRVRDSGWILEQAAGRLPCYVILDEYVRMIHIALWRFPALIDEDMLDAILAYSNIVLFSNVTPPISLGREVCLANVMYLSIVILQHKGLVQDIVQLILKGLRHPTYEVVLSAMNYILILHNALEADCEFQRYFSINRNEQVLSSLRNDQEYIRTLRTVAKCKYLECVQQSLTILSLEEGTQKDIIAAKFDLETDGLSDEDIIRKLFHCIECKNATHIYLRSLSKFVSDKLARGSLSGTLALEVIREVYACSSSDNSEDTRMEVVEFLEPNLRILLGSTLGCLTEEERFELEATVISTTVRMLEDDDETVRQRASCAVCAFLRDTGSPRCKGSVGVKTSRPVVASLAAALLRSYVCEGELAIPTLVVLALLDFKSEVCLTDELSDECRVFDQNERYNIFLEESMWTSECADLILDLTKGRDAAAVVRATLTDPLYSGTFDRLCSDNLVAFQRIVGDSDCKQSDLINPKVGLFFEKLMVR